MDGPLVLVLGDPSDLSLRLLGEAEAGVRFQVGKDASALKEFAQDAEAIFCSTTEPAHLALLLRYAGKVRWIHTRWAGLENALLPEIVESPAVLTNAKGVYSAALGEYVLASILFFAKDLRRMVASQERGLWDVFDVDMVQGSTLGVVGYGDIGRAIALRARTFGMRILALRRSESMEPDALVDEFVPRGDLVSLMARSDYVAVALPLTRETMGLLDRRCFDAMKRTAVLVNVGRGAVLDEGALLSALEARRIRGAALDVFQTEPLPAGHPFYRLKNVLLSAHCADHTGSWRDDAVRLFLENLKLFRSGLPLKNVVDKRRGY